MSPLSLTLLLPESAKIIDSCIKRNHWLRLDLYLSRSKLQTIYNLKKETFLFVFVFRLGKNGKMFSQR